jgi:hypothetical protein
MCNLLQDDINTIKKIRETLIEASMEAGLEEITEETEYMFRITGLLDSSIIQHSIEHNIPETSCVSVLG